MKTGDVYEWVTDKATGHDTRLKIHVYICVGNWRTDDHVFLFISKSDFLGGYRIEKADGCDFLRLEHSFVSLSSIVSYTEDELRASSAKKLGSLPPHHLKQLYTAVDNSEVMTEWQIKLVCRALAPFL